MGMAGISGQSAVTSRYGRAGLGPGLSPLPAEAVTVSDPDAVLTAFAPADNPKIAGNPKAAVSVIVQGGGCEATATAPMAAAVIKAYLATLGLG
jgi:hypothetical protein